MATCSSTPNPGSQARLTSPGKESGSSAPRPEKDEVKPRSLLSATAEGLAKPGKRRAPMTKDEEETLREVTAQHKLAKEELLARIERLDKLCKGYDELMFKRRCWAATLANQVIALREDIAHVKHQLRVGWKEGDPLPLELIDARRSINYTFVANEHIGRVMDMGLEAFLEDYRKFHENEKMCS